MRGLQMNAPISGLLLVLLAVMAVAPGYKPRFSALRPFLRETAQGYHGSCVDARFRRQANRNRILHVGRLGIPERLDPVPRRVSARAGNFLSQLPAGAAGTRAGAAVGFSGRLQYALYAALI